MRPFGFVLIFAFAFGTASSFSLWGIQLPSWLIPIFGSARDKVINRICEYLAKYPERTDIAITMINRSLQENNQTRMIFVSTLNYINSPENQQKLRGGKSVCPTFFTECQQAIETDLRNNNENLNTIRQRALNMINKFIDALKKFIN